MSRGAVRDACCAQGLLTRVRDNNKHVQEAACSALATLEEAAGRELLESSRITAILNTLAAALQVRKLDTLAWAILSWMSVY